MKIIILSAGIGSRLRPLTENVPKSLLKIDENKSVLERTIENIREITNDEIVVITGYCREKMETVVSKYDNCTTICNPFYRITNSISSLWFAKEKLNDDVIILNADVVLEKKLFKYLFELKNKACVLYDSSIGDGADYKVSQKNGEVVIMSKELNSYSGEYVGATKLSKENAIKLVDKIETMIKNELFNEWYETALVDMVFTEGFKLDAVDVNNYAWTEIDNVNDLMKAKDIFYCENVLGQKHD